MRKDIIFYLQEGLRNIKLLPRHSLLYWFLLSINHLFVIIFFIIYINLNYFKEVLALKIVPYSFNIHLIPTINEIDGLILMLFIMCSLLLFITIYINKLFINKYLKLNYKEIKLILKLKGRGNIVRTPIIYTAFLINLLAIVLISTIIKVPYKLIINIVNEKNNIGIKLLEYNNFDISVIVLLFLVSSIVVVSTSYFLYWDFKNKYMYKW